MRSLLICVVLRCKQNILKQTVTLYQNTMEFPSSSELAEKGNFINEQITVHDHSSKNCILFALLKIRHITLVGVVSCVPDGSSCNG